MSEFRKTYSFDKRKEESSKISEKYPDRVPVIVESFNNNIKLTKQKFLVPKTLTIGQFVYVIRRQIKLAPEKALFLFIGEKYDQIPMTSSGISEIYADHKNEDGFLYVAISEEKTFGN
jgi:GABA(A) receptor-associated protein